MLLFLLLSPFGAFLLIAGFGALFIVTSFVLGEIFELGDLLGHHDVDLHGGGGPSVISGRVISVFITAFGCFGAIGVEMGWSVGASTLLGVAGGIVFAALLFVFLKFLYSSQSSSDLNASDLIGRTAQVIVSIPKGGVGQIRCTVSERMFEKIARAQDGAEIPTNVLVKVEAVVGETVLVRRAE